MAVTGKVITLQNVSPCSLVDMCLFFLLLIVFLYRRPRPHDFTSQKTVLFILQRYSDDKVSLHCFDLYDKATLNFTQSGYKISSPYA